MMTQPALIQDETTDDPNNGIPTPLTRALTKKEKNDIISIFQLMEKIPDEAAAVAFVEEKVWGDSPICPRCGLTETCYRVKSGKPLPYRCRDCKKYFSVKVGTVMEQSNLSMRVWVLAIYLMQTSPKGMNAIQLHNMLGVSYETAWFLCHRIREAMKQDSDARIGCVGEVVQVDETYVGGNIQRMHAKNKPPPIVNPKTGKISRNWRANKFTVVGLRDKDGFVIAFPVKGNSHRTLQNAVTDWVRNGTTVWSDGEEAYKALPKHGYEHAFVRHGKGQYVDDDGVNTNNIESFWTNFRRAYKGTYHYMSFKHLHRYVNEFVTRNNNGPGNGFETIGRVLRQMVGERLTINGLMTAPAYARE